MADTEGSADPQITFKVKTSGDGLHTITMAESATVLELKSKLATADYENIPVERQRLIYSGRVMKNDDTLGSYKIKAGNTLHLVKSAASNHPPAGSSAAAASAGAAAGAGGSSVPPAVPTNMAAGTPANNLLAGLTGARFAGHAALPNQDIFGPDGGMNLPSEDHLSEMMANPAVAQSVNEALNNPTFVDFLLQNNPALRATPHARELIQSPMFRHMLTDPESLRMMSRMRRAMAGGGGAGAFPAPGATDNTPADAPASPSGGAGGNAGAAANPFGAGFNPFMFGGFPGAEGNAAAGGAAGGAAANPFAAFFPPNFGAAGAGAGAGAEAGGAARGGADAAAGATGAAATGAGAGAGTGAGADAAANPFSFLFGPGGLGGAGGAGGGAAPQGFPQVTPEMMQQAMQALGGAGGGLGGGAGAGGFNPFMPAAPAAPDTRPPEELYAEQLRQLNDMGFYDFDQNVAALRRSGGSVEGAIQRLLGD